MDNDKARELLNSKWPGMDDALVGLLEELQGQLKDEWMMAKIKTEVPVKFKETMVKILTDQLVKLDHPVLAELASVLLTPVIFNTLAVIGKAVQDKKGAEEA